MPKSNKKYWTSKFERNVQRFKDVSEQIQSLGWRVIVVWECEIKDIETLTEGLLEALQV